MIWFCILVESIKIVWIYIYLLIYSSRKAYLYLTNKLSGFSKFAFTSTAKNPLCLCIPLIKWAFLFENKITNIIILFILSILKQRNITGLNHIMTTVLVIHRIFHVLGLSYWWILTECFNKKCYIRHEIG